LTPFEAPIVNDLTDVWVHDKTRPRIFKEFSEFALDPKQVKRPASGLSTNRLAPAFYRSPREVPD